MRFKSIFPEIMGIIVALLLLNLWYLSSLAIEHRVMPSTYDYIVNATVVLSAAFCGSFSAFYLNTRKERKIETSKKVDALNSALFITIQQINGLLLLKKAIEHYKNDPIRFLTIPSIYAPDYSALKVNLSRLEFMLKEHPNLLLDLSVEQGRFESAVRVTNMRADFHHKELQVALSNCKFNIGQPSIEQLINAVGERIVGTGIRLTDEVFSHVLLSVDSAIEVHNKLHEVALAKFPGKSFIKF